MNHRFSPGRIASWLTTLVIVLVPLTTRAQSTKEMPLAGDSGAVAPGAQSVVRYTDEWGGRDLQCGQGFRLIQQRLYRESWHDTVDRRVQYTDTTVAPLVRQWAERCHAEQMLATALARVSAGADHPTFINLVFVAALLHRDTLARDLIRAHMSRMRDVIAQVNLYGVLAELLLDDEAHPPHIAIAKDVLAGLETLYRKASPGDLMPAANMLKVSEQITDRLRQVKDTAALRQICEWRIAREKELGDSVLFVISNATRYNFVEANQILLVMQILPASGPRSRQAVDWLNEMGRRFGKDRADYIYPLGLFQTFGKTFTYPVTKYWYGPDGTALTVPPGQSPVPEGAVTLVLPVRPDLHANGLTSSYYPGWAALRRTIEQYRTRGLQVVLIAQTNGWTRERGAVTPEQEAVQIRHYFQDELRLPVTIAVDVSPMRRREAPDDRLIRGKTTWEKAWVNPMYVESDDENMSWGTMRAFLLDQHGRVAYVSYWPGENVIPTWFLEEQPWLERLLLPVAAAR